MMVRSRWVSAVFGIALAAAVAAGAACGSRAEESAGPATTTVAAAELLVANALREAEVDNKAVLIEFGASWCRWCENFQAFVNSDEAGRIVRDNYVIVTLAVREEEEHKSLENPGGAELMADWTGATAGLPFYVILDSVGNKIGDSNGMPDGTNIGYPVSDVEIERFMDLIDRTAPRISEPERAIILEYLQETAEL